jgi:hypothetical protein
MAGKATPPDKDRVKELPVVRSLLLVDAIWHLMAATMTKSMPMFYDDAAGTSTRGSSHRWRPWILGWITEMFRAVESEANFEFKLSRYWARTFF